MSVLYPRAQLAAIANKVKVISLSRPARFLVLSLRTALSLHKLQLELNEFRLRVLASRCLNIVSCCSSEFEFIRFRCRLGFPILPRPKAHLRNNTYGSVADTSPYKCFERGNIPENQPLNIINTMAILEVKSVPFDNRINNDAQSGAHLILSTWKPVCISAYFMLLENRGKFTRYQWNPAGITLVPLPPMVIEMQLVSS